jgi:hypothetical protein
MSKTMQIVVAVAAAIVLGGGGFVAGVNAAGGGTRVAIGGAGRDAGASASPSGAGGRRVVVGGGGAGQGQVAGRVLSVGDGSITVETRQPGSDQTTSVIALVGGNARVVRSTETDIKASDIKVGDQVLVVGQPDTSTGAVAANTVIVGIGSLQQLFGGGQGAAGGSGAPRRATPTPSPTP